MPGLEPGTCRLEDDRSDSIELHRRENWSGQQDLNLRTLVSKTSPYSHLWNARIGNWQLAAAVSSLGMRKQQPICDGGNSKI